MVVGSPLPSERLNPKALKKLIEINYNQFDMTEFSQSMATVVGWGQGMSKEKPKKRTSGNRISNRVSNRISNSSNSSRRRCVLSTLY